jgi:hypothetical protein
LKISELKILLKKMVEKYCRLKSLLYICVIKQNEKRKIMKNIWIERTGMTRQEVEKLYIESINDLMSLGATEEMAREIVQETLKEKLGL